MKKNQFLNVSVSELRLDPENPRLPERLKRAQEKDVLNWMLSDATLVDLMASIAENGFFNGEPILALKENGKYTVVEGNRRLAAIKILENPELVSVSPKTVKVIADNATQKGSIPQNIWIYVCSNRDEVKNYLGFRHISGVKQWPLISKARYLYSLFQAKKDTSYEIYKELAREIGSKGAYVKKLIIGYQVFQTIQSKKYYGISDLDEENFDLSLISEAVNDYSAVAEYLGIQTTADNPLQNLDQERLGEATKWLYQITASGSTRIGDNRNLRLLSKVLQNEAATKAFVDDKRPILEAAELTDLTDENIRFYLQQAKGSLIEVQRVIHKAKYPDKKDEDLIEEITSSIDLISSHLKKLVREKKLTR